MGSWFPRPASPVDVRAVPPPERWAVADVCELLNAPEALEWRDRVGVVGRTDGSGRSSTRLLLARGWVAKTRVDCSAPSAGEMVERIVEDRARGLAAQLWHPDKHWYALRAPEGWLSLTVTPELRTLRQLDALSERLRAWIGLLSYALTCSRRYGVGLDLNPSNFGARAGDDHLHYIDDETYPRLAERDVAGFLVARVPEEPQAGEDVWVGWWREVLAMIEGQRGLGLTLDLELLGDEALRYPVAPQFESRRVALADVVHDAVAGKPRAPQRAGSRAAERTCVLADVHGNFFALDAVLDAARSLGADSFLLLGDVVGYGPHPSECIARVAELERAIVLRGNHDHAIATGQLELGMNRLARAAAEWTMSALSLGDRAWLAALPLDHTEDDWMAVHGAPRDPRRFLAYVYDLTFEDNLRYLRDRRTRLCFYGHTHVQRAYVELPTGAATLKRASFDVPEGPTLVNPGSVGQPRDGDARAAFAIWDRRARRIDLRRVSYPLERTLRALRERELPAELERRLTKGA